jgi:hypothetical protein
VASGKQEGSMKKKKGSIARDLSIRGHRLLIGYIGLFLPIVIYIMAGVRPTDGLIRWQLLGSVSAYYYTRGVGVFVGMLFALALFLFSYRGYKDEWIDRTIGKVAAVSALGVPIFPTDPPLQSLSPSWWIPIMGKLHFASAIVLFGSFILFSLWLFRKSDIKKFAARPTEKRVRDIICLICGCTMIASMIWALISHLSNGPIFWPETFAIEAFAVSWLTKGQAHLPIMRLAKTIGIRLKR